MYLNCPSVTCSGLKTAKVDVPMITASSSHPWRYGGFHQNSDTGSTRHPGIGLASSKSLPYSFSYSLGGPSWNDDYPCQNERHWLVCCICIRFDINSYINVNLNSSINVNLNSFKQLYECRLLVWFMSTFSVKNVLGGSDILTVDSWWSEKADSE